LKQQDYELISAVAKEKIRASQAPSRCSNNTSENLIARFLTEAPVDIGHIVNVEN
jgi:hypothetical protein